MSGITALSTLLRNMEPTLDDRDYVFVTKSGSTITQDLLNLLPVATFQESEGITAVIPKAEAERTSMAFEGVFQKITLNVHSNLESVGLTAAVSSALASQNIPANIFAGYYHDHIFVPKAAVGAALSALGNTEILGAKLQ